MKTNSKNKVRVQEIVFYSISGILAIWGIVEIILGLIVEFADVRVSDFPLYQAQQTYISLFGMSFTNWGLVLLSIGVILCVIVLCIYATGYDREAEKESRRAARLQGQIINSNSEISDAEVKE